LIGRGTASMEKPSLEIITSVEQANDCISLIGGYETEFDVDEAARRIVQFFDFQYFVFGALYRNGEQEHYRYIFGCAPEWCYLYIQNKWYAIDPFIGYALKNSSPILASDIPLTSPGQRRMMASASEYGFRSGIVVPAHSASSNWIGLLHLGTDEGLDCAQRSLDAHRNLMRAFGLELLEWFDSRLHDNSVSDLDLDKLDLKLLCKAQEHATAAEAARELGITLALAESRYRRLYRKLDVPAKRHAVDKAVELGLIRSLL